MFIWNPNFGFSFTFNHSCLMHTWKWYSSCINANSNSKVWNGVLAHRDTKHGDVRAVDSDKTSKRKKERNEKKKNISTVAVAAATAAALQRIQSRHGMVLIQCMHACICENVWAVVVQNWSTPCNGMCMNVFVVFDATRINNFSLSQNQTGEYT